MTIRVHPRRRHRAAPSALLLGVVLLLASPSTIRAAQNDPRAATAPPAAEPDAGVVLEARLATDEDTWDPAAGVPLRVTALGPGAVDPDTKPADRSGTTGEDGRLFVPRRPDEALAVRAPEGVTVHLVIAATDPAEGDRREYEISAPLPVGPDGAALLPAGRPVYGRVVASATSSGARPGSRSTPVAGAAVRLEAARAGAGPEPPSALTRPDGWFLILEEPAGRFTLRAEAPEYAPSELPGMILPPVSENPGPTPLGTVELRPGVTVEGVITDLRGRPLEGAEVRFLEAAGRPSRGTRERLLREPAATTSGEDGRFVVADLPAGRRLHVLASHPGHLSTWTYGVATPTVDPLTIALEPAAALAGRLVDEDGEPVAEGRVLLVFPGPPPGTVGVEARRGDGSRRAVTGEDGSFRFEELPPGTVELTASAEGLMSSEAEPAVVELDPGQDRRDVRLVLRRGAVIVGRVTDSVGEPIEGAELRTRTATTRSGPDGRFRLGGLATGLVGLFGYHPDYRRQAVEVDVQEGENQVDITLEEGFILAGVTVDRQGDPVAGARLVVRQEGLRQIPGYPTTSGADGHFRVVVSEEGSFRLTATRDGFAPGSLEGLKLGPVPLEDVVVTLPRGATLTGLVHGLEIDDLGTIRIEAHEERSGSRAGAVDPRGRYVVDNLLPGDWRVTARVGGGRKEASATVVVPEGAETVERDLDLGSGDRVLVEGRVRHRGEPVAAAHVSLDGLDVSGRRSVLTGHDGSFRIEAVEPGRYRLDVLDPARALSHLDQIEIRADLDLDLDLVSERLTGRVVDDESGEPIANALVYVRKILAAGQEGSLVTVGTDPAGGFLLAHVGPGRYRVSARKDGYGPAETVVTVESGVAPPETVVRLARTEGLTLRVRLTSGAVPGLVTVSVFDAAGGRLHTDTRSVTTTGYAYFPQLPPGRWNLRVDTEGAAAGWVGAEVPGIAEIALEPATPLTVAVPALMESGGAGSLTLAGEDGTSHYRIEPNGDTVTRWPVVAGLATVPDLPAGTWSVRVVSPAGEVWTGRAVIDGRAPTRVTLE